MNACNRKSTELYKTLVHFQNTLRQPLANPVKSSIHNITSTCPAPVSMYSVCFQNPLSGCPIGSILMYLLFSEEPGNAILTNIFSVLQQLAHCILHVCEDMSLSCK